MEISMNGTLPALAEKLKEWFPDLKGRALPVVEIEITKENIPTLPVCWVALLREEGGGSNSSSKIEPEEHILVEFWFEPARYKDRNGGETPFWSYYDYDGLRTYLLTKLRDWRTPWRSKLRYLAMDIEATQLAVIISFQFKHAFTLCYLDSEEQGQPFSISTRWLNDSVLCSPECIEPVPEEGCG